MSREPEPGAGVALGIDTASADASLALRRGESVLALSCWRVESTLSRELLAELAEMLAEAGVTRGEITRIAVCAGPGAYTALRIGVATAQGLALALGVPLAGVSRLEADALPYLDASRPVVAVHDAGRGRLAWAAYQEAEGHGAPPRELVAPRADDAEGLASGAPAGALWCGELAEELLGELARAGGGASQRRRRAPPGVAARSLRRSGGRRRGLPPPAPDHAAARPRAAARRWPHLRGCERVAPRRPEGG